MKVKDTDGIISSICVSIDNFEHKGKVFEVEIDCLAPNFQCNRMRSKEPFFIMGKSFWEEEFGEEKTQAIKNLCKKAVAKYKKENNLQEIGY